MKGTISNLCETANQVKVEKKELSTLAKKHNTVVVEDASNAFDIVFAPGVVFIAPKKKK
jgi:hypothetical protein